jgi:glycerol transport system permease protein
MFLLLIMRMIPVVSIFIPFLIVYNQVGLYDTTTGLVIAYLSFNVPIAIWLFTSLMDAIPKEIDESAFVDGYGLWRYFRRIFIPLCMPSVGVVAFFVWYQTWSEMFLATALTQIYGMTLNGNMLVHAVGMGMGGGLGQLGLVSAVGVLTMIPGILLLVFARRYLSRAFTMGRI